MASLLDIRLYQELNELLQIVTEEHIATIVPGARPTSKVHYLGPMTPALKAMLYLLSQAANNYDECFNRIFQLGSSMNEEQREWHKHELSELLLFRTFIEEQFATALTSEYSLDPNEYFGYDEKLDVYTIPEL